MPLNWKRRTGRETVYWTAETPMGRVRVSRVNKRHVPGFKAYFPDGMHSGVRASEREAKEAAEIYIASHAPG